MFDFDDIREILSTMRKNRLRTFLTGFSVAWGIFILIILLAAGNGLRNAVMYNFSNFSANRVDVWPNYTSKPRRSPSRGPPAGGRRPGRRGPGRRPPAR